MEILTKENPGLGKNSSHCSFQDFHSLTKENQVSFSKDFLGSRLYPVRVLGRVVDLPRRMPNPSPTLDKNLASMGPGILSSIGVGVWRKAPEAFPGPNTTLDIFQSATFLSDPGSESKISRLGGWGWKNDPDQW